jgi:pilus assembly protein CpaB
LFLALILAVLSAVLVYAAVTQSGGDGGTSSVETPVVIANQEIAAGTEISEAMLEVTNFADSQAPAGAIADESLVVGLIAKENIAAREAVLTSSVVDTSLPTDADVLAYIIEAERMGMAIEAVQVVGAGGLVLPGDHVDVYWMPEKPLEDTPGALLLAENVEVLAVQQSVLHIGATAPGVVEEGEEPAAPGETDDRTRQDLAEPVPEAITVTLMMSPNQLQNVFCGDNTGALRLAVRAFGDNSPTRRAVVQCIKAGEDQEL